MKYLKKCDFCERNKFVTLFSLTDRMYNINGEYTIQKCKNCGLRFVNPQPEGNELVRHYPALKYYSYGANTGISTREYYLYELYNIKKTNFLKVILFLPLKQLLRTVKIVKNGNALDIGCGAGSFLIIMKKSGMNCYGVEPGVFDKAAAKKHNLKIFNGELKDAKYKSNFFDVITINHVLEHVPNPSQTLEEIHRILKPNGTLIIGVPASDSLAYKFFGKYWWDDVPRHIYTFSAKIIRGYAQKKGFNVQKIRYNSGPTQFLASLLYWTNKFRQRKILLSEKSFVTNKLLFLLFLPVANLCNLLRIGDQFEAILKKK